MNKSVLLLITLFLYGTTLLGQNANPTELSVNKLETIQECYLNKEYSSALFLAQKFIKNNPEDDNLIEVKYYEVSSKYELNDSDVLNALNSYLEEYPETPHRNRIYSLIAACHFNDKNYNEAIAMFNATNFNLLNKSEQERRSYELAVTYINIGQIKNATTWFNMVALDSSKYRNDATYYLGYINYLRQNYNKALELFGRIKNDDKYTSLVDYYEADIYTIIGEYKKAFNIAADFINRYPNDKHVLEMYRILGEGYYHFGNYNKAIKQFNKYLSSTAVKKKRDILYMLGMSYYQLRAFNEAKNSFAQTTTKDDALTQNANLHMGFCFLQLKEKNKARMAFEQAANSAFNLSNKEIAAYNYALCLHETSFSAFGESVKAFENFLNDFPQSKYADEVSGYLVDVYMNTKNYEIALKSINSITRPNATILKAKQNLLFQLGTEEFANNNYNEAKRRFEATLKLGNYNKELMAKSYYWLAEIEYKENKIREARRDYHNYLKITRSRNAKIYSLAYYNLAYINFNENRYSEALKDFQTFIQLNRNPLLLADAYNRMGDCYFSHRIFKEAKHYYAMAESTDNSAGDYSFYQMALIAGLQKDYTGKITLLNRLIGKYYNSPYLINAFYEKGRAYVMLENTEQAIVAFKKLIAQFPKNEISRKAAAEVALLYYQEENFEQAIKAYKEVLTNYPGTQEAQLAVKDLKSIYVDMNRVNEFVELVKTLPNAIQMNSSEEDSLTYIAAEKSYMRKRSEEAKNSFKKYIELFPEGAFKLNAHYFLCLIAEQQRRYDAVLEHSAKILESNNNQFTEQILVMRSEVLFKLHKYNEALACYEELRETASNKDNRILAEIGMLRSAFLSRNDQATIHAATLLLGEHKIAPEIKNEALYYRAKAYSITGEKRSAYNDYQVLAEDTRNAFGAEAKYRIAQYDYESKNYKRAEDEILDFINQSTPHTYWLAKSFILLSDLYMEQGKTIEAKQYLLSLKQNYTENDDIQQEINSRLEALNKQ